MAYNFYNNPAYQEPVAPAAPKPPAPKPAGSTFFWQRIQQQGLQKLQSISQSAGRFLFGNTAKFANQGIQEGKQVVDTARMEAANISHNPIAFRNANEQSQKDYQGFKNKGGIFNEGTLTTAQEAKQGSLKTGLKKIGGGTLGTAAEIVPFGKVTKAAKIYKAGQGLVKASESVGKSIIKQAATGAGAGAAGSAGQQLVEKGKVNPKEVAKSSAIGGVLGGGSEAILKAGKFAIQNGKMIFNRPAVITNPDVLNGKQLDTLTAKTKIPVQDQSSGALQGKVSNRLPAVTKPVSGERPSSKGYSDTNFRLQFNTGAKNIVSKQPDKWTYLDTNLKKVVDPLSRVIGVLSHTSNKGTIRSAVENLLPEIDSNAKNRLVKDISGAKNHQGVADYLWDAAKNHEAKMSAPGTPMGKRISFKESEGTSNSSQVVTQLSREEKSGNISKPVSTILSKPIKSSGKTAPSQLSVKVLQKSVEDKLTEDLGDVKGHTVMNIQDQANKASDLLAKDEQRAIDIATGKRNSPSGIHPHAVFTAVENKARHDGNYDLIRELANSKRIDESTAAGQTLRILRERDSTSPVAQVQHILDARKAAVEKRLGEPITKTVTKTMKEIESHIKAPTKENWASFVESLRC